jgi:Tol biopolymer transport system component
MKRPLALCLATLAVLATLPTAPASAGFPGRNGRIVFHRWAAPAVIADIFTVKRAGGGEQQLTASPAVEDTRPVWSADGTRLAMRRTGVGIAGLWVMNADGTGLVQVPGTDLDRSPAWSPDNTTLVYECRTVLSPVADICVRKVDGSGFVQLTATAGVEETAPVWSPDGARVVFSREIAGGGSHLVSLQVTTLAETAVTAPLAGRYDSWPDWSPSGGELAFTRFVVGTGAGGGVYRVKATGGKLRLVTKPAVGLDLHHTMPAWSPDGTKIAYVVLDDDEAFGHIFTINPDGTGDTQITFGAVTDEFPDWRAP